MVQCFHLRAGEILSINTCSYGIYSPVSIPKQMDYWYRPNAQGRLFILAIYPDQLDSAWLSSFHRICFRCPPLKVLLSIFYDYATGSNYMAMVMILVLVANIGHDWLWRP